MAEKLESDPLEVEHLTHLALEQQVHLTSSELETLVNIQAELDRLNNAELEQMDSAQIPTLSQSVEIASSLENDESIFATEETVESSIIPDPDEAHCINPSDYIEEETVETDTMESHHHLDPNTDISNLDIIMSENIEQIEVSEESMPESEIAIHEEQMKTQPSFVPIVIQSSPSTSSPQTQLLYSTGNEFVFQQIPNTSSSKSVVSSKFVQITTKTGKWSTITSTLPFSKIPPVPKRPIAPSSPSSSTGKPYAKVVISSKPQSPQKNQVIITSQGKDNHINNQTFKMVSNSSPLIHSKISPVPKAIPLAQARQMGLLAGGKLQRIAPLNQGLIVNKIVGAPIQGKVSLVSAPSGMPKSPAKILPAPTHTSITKITKIPTTVKNLTNQQKVIIRQAANNEQIITTGPYRQVRLPSSSTTPIQGNQQLQYVRLLPSNCTSNKTAISAVPTSKSVTTPKPVALISKLVVKPSLAPIGQRIIIPAETTGTGLISTNTNSFVMIPTPYIPQVKATQVTKVATSNLVTTANLINESKPLFTSISNERITTPTTSPIIASSAPNISNNISLTKQGSPNRTAVEPNGIRPRKPCNCTKSQCLKLYCDCFANGEFCYLCNCNNCFNNLNHEEHRQMAIKACLERNPNAFRPKIGKGKAGDERRHNKGCNCKRSNCLKNYCECYEAKIPCSNNCKCIGCHNVEEPSDKKLGGPPLTETLEMSENIQSNMKTKLTNSPIDIGSIKKIKTKKPFSFIESRVISATCSNLLNEARKAIRKDLSSVDAEQLLLHNFGKCLKQVIDSANDYEGLPSPFKRNSKNLIKDRSIIKKRKS